MSGRAIAGRLADGRNLGALDGCAAGLVSRGVAAVVDAVTVAALLLIAWLGWSAVDFIWHPRGFALPQPPRPIAGGGYLLAAVCYLAGAWALSGRTPGSQLMGLRVVAPGQRRVGWGRSAGRAVCCVVFPFGLLWSAVSVRQHAAHDAIFRTEVIYDWTPR